jgi:catechol 2,3-dioxygenase-like lactoylglutathione lyase family enzyme
MIIVGLQACASITWAQTANQVGIAHVAFRVSDLDSARAFYARLGFEQFFEIKQGERTTEAFLKINDHQFLELYPQTSPAQPLGLMHVCYESSDLEALHAEFAQARGLTVSDVRKAAAGNLLMTMKDPEGQTIEYTQYLPGSRHFEDRGQHLGAHRVSQSLVGATTAAHDPAAIAAFYEKLLGFTALAGGRHLRMPGNSGQQLEIVADGAGGIQFGVADPEKTAAALKELGLAAKKTPPSLTVAAPDGVTVSFLQ